jgi:hypothetical protein
MPRKLPRRQRMQSRGSVLFLTEMYKPMLQTVYNLTLIGGCSFWRSRCYARARRPIAAPNIGRYHPFWQPNDVP